MLKAQTAWTSMIYLYPLRKFAMIVGDKCIVTKQITNADIKRFIEISGDSNPIHRQGENSIVHGAYLNALVSSVIGTKLPGPGSLLISQTSTFPKKCFSGEVINITVEVLELRKIITVGYSCKVEDLNKVVLHGTAKLMLNK
uniref:Uncharacterized protein n=1 Tax=Photinus pyralis TaxID=7054 RepID=A0A1Y1LDC4_PHOPY